MNPGVVEQLPVRVAGLRQMAPDDPSLDADGDVAAAEPEPSAERQAKRLRVLDLNTPRGEIEDRDRRGAEAAGKRFNGTEAIRRAELVDLSHAVGKRTLPSLRLLYVSSDPVTHQIRNRRRYELPFLHTDEDVLPLRHDPLRRGIPPHLEIHMERARAEVSEIGVDDQELVERHRKEKVALDVDPRQPDSDVLDQRLVRQPARPEELDLRKTEEAEVRLVVDDSRRVDVFPPDVLGNRELHGPMLTK